ncbi:hypothetical protein AB0D54_07660 [Streptomyces xanthophaeus]|uniref:hypothetical protein n=1 Tax=Streptomyces xanthophaeus TaxID=67385 RepID=UPI00344A0B70
MRNATAVAGAAAVLAGLITAAGPASAATGAAACSPGIELLPAVQGQGGGIARGFGTGGLVVGESGGWPAYWTGAEHTAHAVPLPAGFDRGSVKAVSAKGLMVGTATRASDHAKIALTHQLGAATSEALTTPVADGYQVDVDVNESGRGVAVDQGVAKEWVNGKVVRELPVPADAIPGTKVILLSGINKRGDIVGTASGSFCDADNDTDVTKTFPVVRPAGGGYPPFSLQVWNGYHSSYSTIGRDIDERGRVVGVEDYYYRNDPALTPAVWKKPYDALPADPGRLGRYRNIELSGQQPDDQRGRGHRHRVRGELVQLLPGRLLARQGAPAGAAAPPGLDPRHPQPRLRRHRRRPGRRRLVDRETRASSAVIWTCASKQAYAQPS